MLDGLAFARLIESRSRQDQERWRRDQDAYYQEFAADPPALIVAIACALSFLASHRPARHAQEAAPCRAGGSPAQ